MTCARFASRCDAWSTWAPIATCTARSPRAALLRRRHGIAPPGMTYHRSLADREDVLGGVMLAPALAYVILLVGVPFVFAIVLGFSNATAGSLSFGWTGLDNYSA